MALCRWPQRGWAVAIAGHRAPAGLGAGVSAWFATVTVGMALRVLAGQGTALPFVLVAFGFLGATMAGWRVIWASFPPPGRCLTILDNAFVDI